MRLNVSRQACGSNNGSRPSNINIRPSAIKNELPIKKIYFLAGLRMYLKKSEFGSNTITSLLALKLFL